MAVEAASHPKVYRTLEQRKAVALRLIATSDPEHAVAHLNAALGGNGQLAWELLTGLRDRSTNKTPNRSGLFSSEIVNNVQEWWIDKYPGASPSGMADAYAAACAPEHIEALRDATSHRARVAALTALTGSSDWYAHAQVWRAFACWRASARNLGEV